MSAYLFISYDKILLFIYTGYAVKAFTSDYFYMSRISELFLKNYPSAEIGRPIINEIVENAFNLVKFNVTEAHNIEITGFLDDTLNVSVADELSRRLSSKGYEKITVSSQADFIKRYAESVPGYDNILVINLGYCGVKLFNKKSGFVPCEIPEGLFNIITRAREIMFQSTGLAEVDYSKMASMMEALGRDAETGIDHAKVMGAPIRIPAYNFISGINPEKILVVGLFHDIVLKVEFLKARQCSLLDENFVRKYLDGICERDRSRLRDEENEAKKIEARVLFENAARALSCFDIKEAERLAGEISSCADEQAAKNSSWASYYKDLFARISADIETAKNKSCKVPEPVSESGPSEELPREAGDEILFQKNAVDAGNKPDGSKPLKLIFVEIFLMLFLALTYFGFLNSAIGPDEFASFKRYWYLLPAAGAYVFFIDSFPVISFPALLVFVYLVLSGGGTGRFTPTFVLALIPFICHLLSLFFLHLKAPRNETNSHSANIAYLSMVSVFMAVLTVCGIVTFSFSGYMNTMAAEYASGNGMENTVKKICGTIGDGWNPLIGDRIGLSNHAVEFYAGRFAQKGTPPASDLNKCRETAEHYYTALNHTGGAADLVSSYLGGLTSKSMAEEIAAFSKTLYDKKIELAEKICAGNVMASEKAAASYWLKEPEKLQKLKDDVSAALSARKKTIDEREDAYKLIETVRDFSQKTSGEKTFSLNDAELDKLFKDAAETAEKAAKDEAAVLANRTNETAVLTGVTGEAAITQIPSITTPVPRSFPVTEEIMLAIKSSEISLVKKCLESIENINFTDREGWSPLSAAVKAAVSTRDSRILVLLLEKPGTDPDIKNRNGWTPLTIAVAYRQLDSALLLLQHKAGIDLKIVIKGGRPQDELQEWTPLMLAVQSSNEEMIRALLEKNANAGIFNNKNVTALEMAKRNKKITRATIKLMEKNLR